MSKPFLTRPGLMLHIMHNLAYWMFLVPFITAMSFGTGFVMYSIILLIRFIANTYINVRDLSPAQYYAYPLRIP